MKSGKSIKKIIALVMLIFFTISITPKKYFHDIFSQHADELFTQNQTGEKQIGAHQFNCGFVNIVATAPFISCADRCDFQALFFSNFYHSIDNESWWHLIPPPFSLRGPPLA